MKRSAQIMRDMHSRIDWSKWKDEKTKKFYSIHLVICKMLDGVGDKLRYMNPAIFHGGDGKEEADLAIELAQMLCQYTLAKKQELRRSQEKNRRQGWGNVRGIDFGVHPLDQQFQNTIIQELP